MDLGTCQNNRATKYTQLMDPVDEAKTETHILRHRLPVKRTTKVQFALVLS